MNKKVKILDSLQAEAKLLRMAYEIFENIIEEKEIILAGIEGRGMDIAKILKIKLDKISTLKSELVMIEIDKNNPVNCKINTNIELHKKSIIVVDDVANSGRTLLYALNPFLNIIAKRIQIAVLVDRKHKSYPIAPDYIGLSISTTLQEHISVTLDKNKIEGAYLV